MIYLQLFWSFFQIGLFSVGGGYACLPLIQAQVTQVHSWLTVAEFTDVVALSQPTPGPIAINAATFCGIKTAGLFGGLVATCGVVLPSIIIVLILARLYSRYKEMKPMSAVLKILRPVAVALIASAALTIIKMALFGGDEYVVTPSFYVVLGLAVVSFVLLRKFKLNPMWIMLGSGIVGMIIFIWI